MFTKPSLLARTSRPPASASRRDVAVFEEDVAGELLPALEPVPARPRRIAEAVRVACVALLVLVAVALAATPDAGASARQFSIIDGGGLLLSDQTRDRTLDEIRAMGTRDIRVVLYWRWVAPSPDAPTMPAFDPRDPNQYPADGWQTFDRLLGAARQRGIAVHLTITGPPPNWAATRAGTPKPASYRAFVQAVGRRYGRLPKTWSLWNEPNQRFFLTPQWRRKGRRKVPVAPRVYRRLYQEGRRGLRAAGLRREPVLFGELAPRGGGSIPPLRFLREALCLNKRYQRTRRKCARLPASGFAFHVYVRKTGPFERAKGDSLSLNALRRLGGALDRAGRAGRISRRLGIYLTEAGVITRPRRDGARLSDQATFMGASERIADRYPRVRAYAQYLLDDPPADGSGGAFITGLRRAGGIPKPGLHAWRLPLSVSRSGRRAVRIWGLVRPARAERRRTRAVLEIRDGRRWRFYKRVRTNRRGAYTARGRFKAGRRYRVKWQGITGPSVRVLRWRAPQR